MQARAVMRLWSFDPNYRKRAQQDVLLVRQYSMLLAVIAISVLYRMLAVLIGATAALHQLRCYMQFLYMALRCDSDVSSGYVVTMCAENACFVCACFWTAGGATEDWLAGTVNRTASPLLQAASFGCLCANVAHFFATAFGDAPSCWPAFFIGLLWGLTWLNVASFATVAALLALISSPMNLFDTRRQTDVEEPPSGDPMGRE